MTKSPPGTSRSEVPEANTIMIRAVNEGKHPGANRMTPNMKTAWFNSD